MKVFCLEMFIIVFGVLLLVTLAAALQIPQVLVQFDVPSEAAGNTALYWAGHEDVPEKISDSRPWFGNSDMENLLGVLPPGSETSENVFPGSAFVLRSADMSTRVRVTVNLSPHDEPERKYTLKIVNLAMEDRSGPYPVEVKHSDGGFLWVEPSEFMEHTTGENHPFEVRDRGNNPVFTITIRGHSDDEL